MAQEKFWLCWAESTEGGYHYGHGTLESARQEAERLARMPGNRGRKVYILECIAYCAVPEAPVEWHEVSEV